MTEEPEVNLKNFRNQLKEVEDLVKVAGETPDILELKAELLSCIEEEEKKIDPKHGRQEKSLKTKKAPLLEERLKRPLDPKISEEIAKKQVYKTQGGYEIPKSLKILETDNKSVKAEKKRRINQVKQMQSNDLIDEETCKKANNWQRFLKKTTKKKVKKEPKII